jgi:hypothetical protein
MVMNQQVARRQQHRAAFQHRLHLRLAEYVDAVAVAVRALGFTVGDIHLRPSPDLDAAITVGRGPDPMRDGGDPKVPERIGLAWAEDVGWSVTYPDTSTADTSTSAAEGGTAKDMVRYLHLDLVPSPETVAGFLVAVLLDGGDVGMPYPATFRLRSQPLQPVLDALERHTHTASAPLTTPSASAPVSTAHAAAV